MNIRLPAVLRPSERLRELANDARTLIRAIRLLKENRHDDLSAYRQLVDDFAEKHDTLLRVLAGVQPVEDNCIEIETWVGDAELDPGTIRIRVGWEHAEVEAHWLRRIMEMLRGTSER